MLVLAPCTLSLVPPQDEAVSELTNRPEGTFLLRMSQTDAETYSISVV